MLCGYIEKKKSIATPVHFVDIPHINWDQLLCCAYIIKAEGLRISFSII